jgi:hypothetical protein
MNTSISFCRATGNILNLLFISSKLKAEPKIVSANSTSWIAATLYESGVTKRLVPYSIASNTT